MNGLDFFSSPSATGDDDDWGDFVDSSPRIADRNGSEKKSQANSRGPVPLSVFGEEEEGDESGASFNFSFDSFSSKRTGSVNTNNPSVGISGLIAKLYRENGQTDLTNLPEKNLQTNGNHKESLSSQNFENSTVSLETLNWNSLNLDTERTSNVVNSSTTGVASDPNYSDEDVDDSWEFKTAEDLFQSADGGYKEERENTKSGSVAVPNTTNLSSSVWSSPANFDTGRLDAVKSVFDQENGDDDPWGSDGWEFKVAEAGEPKNDLTNKEPNGWGLGFGFEPVSKIETTKSFQPNFEKEPQKSENGSISFPSNANSNSEGKSLAFKQPSLETGNEKEEKEVLNKPKGLLPLSFFEDEKLGTSDTLAHEDNLVSVCNFSMKDKTKARSPTVSINDLISSLYSQVEEKNAVKLSEKSDGYGFVSVEAATDSNIVNGEDDSWEFQGPTNTMTDLSKAERGDEFDSAWQFQGPSLALKSSDVADGVDEFVDDSWEFQGPTQPVRDSMSRKGDNGSWESEHCSVENEVGNRYSVPVISTDHKDYQDVFHKLKTELYYIALNHLKTLKETCDLAADSDEVSEVQKCDGEIQELQNWLNSDVLISEVNLANHQPRSSGITELCKALQEPKFRVYSEDLLSERLLLAEKDWKLNVELLKHTLLTLKILNVGSPEQQSKYTSTWFVIASACAQELGHAATIWKQVIKNDVQEAILSKPQGKSYALSVGEIYRVVKILRASTRLYRPWILLAPTSPNVLAVLDECVKLWLGSGLEEALRNNFNCRQRLDRDYSADQLLESIKNIDEVDAFTLHTCITSATSPSCYISGLNTEIVRGVKTVEWNGEHYLVPLANLWANLISRDPPSLPGYHYPTVS